MAQFYASIQGNRGQATRMGTKKSGMSGHIRGWDVGACVYLAHNETTGMDEVRIYLTSGSNGRLPNTLIGKYTTEDLKLE